MTAPNGKHEFEAAKIFFEERLKDYLKQDKSLAVQDKPDGLVHPIYMGRRVETYYRAAIAALSNLAEENEGAEIVMKAMMIEIDNLKEEAEQGKALIADLTRDMNEYHDKAEKAEAERELLNKELRAVADDLSFLQPATTAEDWGYRLSKVAARRLRKAEAELEKVKDNLDMMTKNRDYWLEKTQGAKAKLARFAPLIEAAEKVSERDLGRVFMGFISTEMRELLEAIKSSKSGTVSRGKDDIPGENPSEPKGDGDPVDDGLSPEDMKKREEQFKYDEMERRHEQSVEDAHDKESEPKGGRE